MNTHAFEKKLHSLKARFGLQLFVLAAVVCTSWIVTDHANAVYILTGPEDAAIVLNEEEVREGGCPLSWCTSPAARVAMTWP